MPCKRTLLLLLSIIPMLGCQNGGLAGPPQVPTPTKGDIWFELDYSDATTSTTPHITYSQTDGWADADWAPQGAGALEVWDLYNGMAVEIDPIGKSLTIGSSDALQVLIGLEKLKEYSSAVVRVEGRGTATSSSTSFDVYNPLNSIGASASIERDWSIHVVELDLQSALVAGVGLQGIRVQPTTNGIALVRLRVSLLGAAW